MQEEDFQNKILASKTSILHIFMPYTKQVH